MRNKFKLGVIGAGFMATAIVNGITAANVLSSSEIVVNDVSFEQLKKISKIGVNTETDLKKVADYSEFLLFAVKPQNAEEVLSVIESDKPLKIISIMAGFKRARIKSFLPNAKVARCMPNTPCSILEGAVGVDVTDFSGKDRDFILKILSSFAEVVLSKYTTL